jgi:hypothetical protein
MTVLPLFRLLVQREAGRAVWLQLAVLVLIGGAAGYLAVPLLVLDAPEDLPAPFRYVVRFEFYAGLMLLFLCGLRLLTRPIEDRAAGWMVPWVVATGRQRDYLLFLLIAVVVATAVAWVTVTAAFVSSVALFGGGTDHLARLPGALRRLPLLWLGFGVLALLIGLLARDTATAVAAAAALVLAPGVATLIHFHVTGMPSAGFIRLTMIHLPPPTTGFIETVWQFALYFGVYASLILVTARRVVGRIP